MLVEFARFGAARYVSHLDTARALRRTFARAGVELALTQGLRPKVRLSLGLPLPVGAAGQHELALAVTASTVGEPRGENEELAEVLTSAAPPGISVTTVERVPDGLRLHPRVALYEWTFARPPAGLREAVEKFRSTAEVSVERRSPKATRTLDLRRYVVAPETFRSGGVTVLRFGVRHRQDGAARPREVLDLLTAWATRAGADDVPGGSAGAGEDVPSSATLERRGVIYDGLAPRGSVREWLEHHETEA
jgi:radical SAM-linked protein